MQRAKTRGADLKPNPAQFNRINAEKCIVYLRGIGVEIDDRTAESWMDIQATHRFLASEKNIMRERRIYACRCGEMVGAADVWNRPFTKRNKRPQSDAPSATCEHCESSWSGYRVEFYVCRDGSVLDMRSASERVVPLDSTPLDDTPDAGGAR